METNQPGTLNLLFLDNDHVLNCGDADRHPNRYLPLCWRHVEQLNRILAAVPDLKVVVSSAWRYYVLNGDMTLKGLEGLYQHFGADMFGRLHGVTAKDKYHMGDPAVEGWTPEEWHEEGLVWRAAQIADYVAQHQPKRFVVLDDLPLNIANLVQTARLTGLTNVEARSVINHFLGLVDAHRGIPRS